MSDQAEVIKISTQQIEIVDEHIASLNNRLKNIVDSLMETSARRALLRSELRLAIRIERELKNDVPQGEE